MNIIGYDEALLLTSNGIKFGTLDELEAALRALGRLTQERPPEVDELIATLKTTMQDGIAREKSGFVTTPYFAHNSPGQRLENPFVSLELEVTCAVERGYPAGYLLKIRDKPALNANITTSHTEARLAQCLTKPYDLHGIEMHWIVARTAPAAPSFDVRSIVAALQSVKGMNLADDDVDEIVQRSRRHVAEEFRAACRGYAVEWSLFGDRQLAVPRLAVTVLRGNRPERGMHEVATNVKEAINRLRRLR